MACRLVVLGMRSGVRPAGIGKKIHRVLAKLVMRETGDQAKTACGNIDQCAGLEAGIYGAPHAVEQRRIERSIETE